jgi:hypothetical protein
MKQLLRVKTFVGTSALLRYQLFAYRDLWDWLDHPFQSPPGLDPAAEQLVLEI